MFVSLSQSRNNLKRQKPEKNRICFKQNNNKKPKIFKLEKTPKWERETERERERDYRASLEVGGETKHLM